ncbi:MAG: type II secretion system protein, partial [Phycisphaerae bacterium]|nr:type II secretion system protein [Phycisphaerae bacterium]
MIELLVVIAILSLLVAILVPSLTKAKELARETVCATNARQIVLATTLYAESNNGKTPLHVSWSQGCDCTNIPEYSPNECARLAVQDYLPPEMLYSPCDAGRRYPESWTDSVASEQRRWWSYTLREPLSEEGASTLGLEPEIPAANMLSSWVHSYSLEQLAGRATTADRFANNYIWSFHGGDEILSIGPNYENGRGWHVGFGDGSVGWVQNDPDIFTYDNNGPGGWARRDQAWIEFDRS